MNRSITYIVPAHNEAETLPTTVRLLRDRLGEMPGSEIVIVENGSSDDTPAVAAALAQEAAATGPRVVARQSAKGLANALRAGIEVAAADWVCCTAADLPFGFTDLDAFLRAAPPSGIAIGSKAHPDSVVERSGLRRTMTFVFRVARMIVLGMRVRDPQGSLFVERRLAQRLGPATVDGGFLFGTELVALAQAEGAQVIELPVVLEPLRGGSTVRPVRDSLDMLVGLVGLRHRLRRERADEARAAGVRAPLAEPVASLARGRQGAAVGAVVTAVGLLLGTVAVAAIPLYLAAATLAVERWTEGDRPLSGSPGVVGIAALVAGACGAAVIALAIRARQRARPART